MREIKFWELLKLVRLSCVENTTQTEIRVTLKRHVSSTIGAKKMDRVFWNHHMESRKLFCLNPWLSLWKR